MSTSIEIAPFSDDDLIAHKDLFTSYFSPNHHLLTDQYCQWLYAANPSGKALMVKVLDGDRWVGFMAMIPVSLILRNFHLKAYYVVNVLVHPDFHGKHLFGRMIKAAKLLVKEEGCALVGHPNDMAIKSWQRARMNFQESLEPRFVIPSFLSRAYEAHEVVSEYDLTNLNETLSRLESKSSSWKVMASKDFIVWRFLNHPINKYIVQKVYFKKAFLGIQISRKLKPGINILIDQYIPEEHLSNARKKLPIFTACFFPTIETAQRPFGSLKLPLKKRIPFFMTFDSDSPTKAETHLFGLSASDF